MNYVRSVMTIILFLSGGNFELTQMLAQTITGCLSTSGQGQGRDLGTLYHVQVGTAPSSPCRPGDLMLSWNQVSPDQIARLDQRITSVETKTQPQNFFVDCTSGQKLADVLAQAATVLAPGTNHNTGCLQ